MASSLIHWELMVSDVARTKTFYQRVFDWKFTPMGPEYTMIDAGGGVGGGLMAKPPGAPSTALHAYFRVEDIDRTLRDVVEAGGRVIVPRTEIPQVGWFAMFADPDGIPIGILQPRGM